MSSTYGENLKLSIFGQSHGAGIGMTLDGIPAGLPVNLEKLQWKLKSSSFLNQALLTVSLRVMFTNGMTESASRIMKILLKM